MLALHLDRLRSFGTMAELPGREEIVGLLDETLTGYVDGDLEAESVVAPPEVMVQLDRLLASKMYTVRDGILVLLAMEVRHGRVIDWREQGLYNPARSASRDLCAEIYPRLHISGSREALQTGVKGVSRYIDRSNDTWKAILNWATAQADIAPVRDAFLYLAAGVADTARNLPDMPRLDTPKLTFMRVFGVVDDLLSQGSFGAYEQFAFAALLEAWMSQLDEPGVVETKNLNASDASAGTAGDVQHRHRGQVTEAYEVTSAGWATKVDQAVATLRRNDLARVHIVARDTAGSSTGELAAALPEDADVSVLDVREEARSFVARLGKAHRRQALEYLYYHLVGKQSRDELVQTYVEALRSWGVTDET